MAPERSGAHRVVVVGAGIGGLVSALLLARQGLQVTLVESAAAPGGKMRQLQVDGAGIDAGPTVFTMRWVFEQILEQAGFSMADLPALTPLPVLARHAWRGHDARLDLFADPARSVAAIGDFAGAAEARRFQAFCRQAREVYQRLETPYIRGPRPTLWSISRDLGPRGEQLAVERIDRAARASVGEAHRHGQRVGCCIGTRGADDRLQCRELQPTEPHRLAP